MVPADTDLIIEEGITPPRIEHKQFDCSGYRWRVSKTSLCHNPYRLRLSCIIVVVSHASTKYHVRTRIFLGKLFFGHVRELSMDGRLGDHVVGGLRLHREHFVVELSFDVNVYHRDDDHDHDHKAEC